MISKRTVRVTAFSAVLAVALAGCNGTTNNPVGIGSGGGSTGTVRGMVADNPNGVNPSVQSLNFDVRSADGLSNYTGTISGQASMAISADGSAWVDLGNPNNFTIQAQTNTNGSDVTGAVSVQTGTYSHVRLILHNVTLQLNAGSLVGGVTLTSAVTVEIGGGQDVTVEATVPSFTVSADASTETDVIVNLNSQAWVTDSTVQAQAVSAAEVQAAAQASAAATTS